MIEQRLLNWPLLVVSLTLILHFSPPTQAQQNTNLTVKIPIKKERRYYDYTSENGSSRSCGVRLYGVFDVFKNYTNISSYPTWRAALVGIQNPSSPTLVIDGERKYFQIYCYFNGRSGPDRPGVDCNFTIGGNLPEWEVTLTRIPPRADFTTTFFPPTPGEVKFQATSVDPEDPEGNLLTHAWDFGDNSTGSGDIQIHRYAKPGRFSVKLTATNPDGLFGNAIREVRIPSPTPIVSVQLFNKHSRNRIEPDEEFRVRLTVAASMQGVGTLTNVAFTGPALTIPSIFRVVSAPTQTEIETLQPGQKKEASSTFSVEWIGYGKFSGDEIEHCF